MYGRGATGLKGSLRGMRNAVNGGLQASRYDGKSDSVRSLSDRFPNLPGATDSIP